MVLQGARLWRLAPYGRPYEHGKGPITVRGKAFIEGSEDPDESLPESSSSTESKRRTGRRKVGTLQCLLCLL